MRTSFSLNPKYLCNLLIALSWFICFFTFFPKLFTMCSSKNNLLSILIPSSFMDFSEVTYLPSMLRVYWLHISEFRFTIIVWNLSAFTIMLFSLNQSVTIWFYLSRVFNSFSTENSAAEIVLSSAELCSSESLTL